MVTVSKATQHTRRIGRTCRNPDPHSHRHNRHSHRSRHSRHSRHSRRKHRRMGDTGSHELPYAVASLIDPDA